MEAIIKTLSEIQDISDGIIVGYANVYNVKDSDGDISLPGSFAKTVTERKNKIKIFKNHQPGLVGVPTELDIADTYGLKMVAQMAMETEAGRNAWLETKFLKENGFESGLSIGGWIVKRGIKNKSEVAEYKLKEISVLTTDDPANEYSLIDTVKAVKDLSEPNQEEFWRLIEKAYNERFSDNILKSLEQFLTLGQEPDASTPVNEPPKLILDFYKLFN